MLDRFCKQSKTFICVINLASSIKSCSLVVTESASSKKCICKRDLASSKKHTVIYLYDRLCNPVKKNIFVWEIELAVKNILLFTCVTDSASSKKMLGLSFYPPGCRVPQTTWPACQCPHRCGHSGNGTSRVSR